MDSMARFLQKLKELIKGKVTDGVLSEDDFNSAVRQAAGHAGGMTRWAKTSDKGSNHMNEFKLLSEIVLSEDGKTGRVQIFPAVGKYSHPRYGELDISKGFLDTVKSNFDHKIYQQELPLTIDLEHQTALSGAAGWISNVEIDGDKGMWATVEFNDRGKSLVGADAYRYFSPEFYDRWTDPASNEAFTNVLIGGALTNRPFFKGMSPVAMMSEDAMYFMEPVKGDMEMMDECAPDMLDMMDDMQDMIDGMGQMMEASPDMASSMKGLVSQMQGMMDRMYAIHKAMPDSTPSGMGMAEPITKTEGGEKFPAEAYLYTPSTFKPSTWKLRIWETPALKVTRAQLGRAAAAFSPGGFRGQKVEIPSADKAGVLSKLRAEYAKLGAKPDEMPAYIKASLTEASLSEAEASAVLVDLGLAETRQGGTDMGMTEEEARQLTELRDGQKALTERLTQAEESRKAAEAKATALEDSLKQASERVAQMQRESTRKTLSEFVRANRLAFQGEVEKAVDRLESMSSKLTEEEFSEYMAERETWHAQMRESALLTPIGRQGGAPATGPAGEFDAAVQKAMAEDKALTIATATTKVASENPALYGRYDKAQIKRARMGGE